MPFTVINSRGATSEAEYQDYLRVLTRVLLMQGVNLADVARQEDPTAPGRWLYVWSDSQHAKEFAEQLNIETETESWIVRPMNAAVSRGPLRPLEVQVGRHRQGWTFALAPWAHKALQAQFPGSCRSNTVTISSDNPQEGMEHWTGQILLILTGLRLEQLRPFGGYVLTDSVTGEVLFGPAPLELEAAAVA